MRWLAMLSLVAACSFRHGQSPTGGDDAASDAPRGTDGVTHLCYGTGLGVQVCPASPPSGGYSVVDTQTVHTDAGSSDCTPLVGPTAGDYCAIVATDVELAGNLIGTGSRPLVIVSTGSLTVSGTIDVASHLIGGNKGAGANAGTCGSADATSSTGGGAGGSFGTAGGNGGSSPGGVAGPVIDVISLRGGCPGTIGKDYYAISGPPGDGGGAVDLIAVSTITISGAIDASGGGGWGALATRNGGQGGGSGGMIVLDAPTVTFDNGSPMLFANGGGGGGGSNGTLGVGGNGADPTGAGAGGNAGNGLSQSGNGGAGGSGTGSGQPGTDGTSGNGNGGGGGGVGIISVFQSAAPTGGMVSPPFT